MKKKVIAMLLVVSMLLASTGCSAYGQVLKLAENYEPPIVEEVIEEVELPEEEILEEDIPNDEEAFERMEEGITEADDATTVTFENGKSFQLTEAAIEGEVELGYKLKGTESILEVAVTTDYPASQLAGDMSELMKIPGKYRLWIIMRKEFILPALWKMCLCWCSFVRMEKVRPMF